MSTRIAILPGLACLALSVAAGPVPSPLLPAIELTACPDVGVPGALCGVHAVPESADLSVGGRTLSLEIVVLPATGPERRPDPVFYLPGGPGAPASGSVRGFAERPARRRHDFVFVDTRGTRGDDALTCEPEAGRDVRDRLAIFARAQVFADCRDRLQSIADLGEYSTPRMVDDIEAVRQALGYGPINLIGTSGGTRTALVYMRRYPASVRAVVLNGAVPLAFRNPLHHARSAQDALDGLVDLCERRPGCAAAYPRLRQEVHEVAERLDRQPLDVPVTHPRTGETIRVRFDRTLFGESLRQLMYSSRNGARIPALVHAAAGGDLGAFADRAVAGAIGVSIPMGMLSSIVCSEDTARIREEEIPAETDGTLLGDTRVRQQLAVCAVWPRARLDPDFAAPVATHHPTLILSGTLDPVTPPRWGEETARHLPQSLHLVVPGGHGVGGPCLDSIEERFLDTGSVRDLDVGCTDEIRYPAFPVS